MSQYKIGTATFTNGSATVTGTGTAWLTNLAAGQWITRKGTVSTTYDAYIIGGIVSDTELTLTAPYGGTTATDVEYVAHKDFTPDGAPLFSNGDVEFPAINNKWKSTIPSFSQAARSVDSIADLPPATGSGNKVNVTSFYPGWAVVGDGLPKGGGAMVDSPEPAIHDGVNAFDPDRNGEIGTAAYYVKSSATLCFVRADIVPGEVDVYNAGARYDGVTDDIEAHKAAILSLAEGGIVKLGSGSTVLSGMLKDDIKDPTNPGTTITLVGRGATEDPGNSGKCTILNFTGGNGIQFDGNRSGGRDFVVSGDGLVNLGGQDNIIVDSSRAQWKNIVTKNSRGDGFRFRFGNSSAFENILCLQNKGNGFNADGTGYVNKAGASRPNDLNACTFVNIDSRANTGVGFRTGVNSGFSNWCYGLTVQGNGDVGAEFNGNYYRVFGFYGEANDAAGDGLDVLFTSTADDNYVWGLFSNNELSALDFWRDDSVNQRNYIDRIKNVSTEYQVQRLLLGLTTSPNGHIKFDGEGDGTNPSITLEGTGGSQTLDIFSSGAGTFKLNPIDGIKLESSIAPTLLNGWANFGGSRKSAGFYKDANGVVHLEGVIAGGTAVNPTQILLLPVGYRPVGGRIYFATTSAGAHASGFIETTGEVYYESGSNASFSLDNISFRAVP